MIKVLVSTGSLSAIEQL